MEADGGDGVHLPQRQNSRGQPTMLSAEDLCPSSDNGQALSNRLKWEQRREWDATSKGGTNKQQQHNIMGGVLFNNNNNKI